MTAIRRPLLISHDFSYSGAPIALLSMARSLKNLGEQPVVVSLKNGPLKTVFSESGIEVAQRIEPGSVSFVLANTIVAVPAALGFKRLGVPIAAWIHESMYFFALLRISVENMGLENLDVILAPSSFQLKQLAPFAKPGTLYQLRNVVRQDFCRLPSDEEFYAVSGSWEERKGQSDLLNLAREAGIRCRFKFIGANPPAGMSMYGGRAGHIFLGPIAPEFAKREIANSVAIVSCAKEETQNLSAIEALMAGRPAMLSDIPAHRILASLIPNVFLFERTSAQSFANAWKKLTKAIPDETRGVHASTKARAIFGEPAFETRLKDVLGIIRRQDGLIVEPYQDVDVPDERSQ